MNYKTTRYERSLSENPAVLPILKRELAHCCCSKIIHSTSSFRFLLLLVPHHTENKTTESVSSLILCKTPKSTTRNTHLEQPPMTCVLMIFLSGSTSPLSIFGFHVNQGFKLGSSGVGSHVNQGFFCAVSGSFSFSCFSLLSHSFQGWVRSIFGSRLLVKARLGLVIWGMCWLRGKVR